MRTITTKEELAEFVEECGSSLCLDGIVVIGLTITPDDLGPNREAFNMSHGRFKDVVFQDIRLEYIDCDTAKFKNVEFKNCMFGAWISFSKCDFDHTVFTSCTIDATDFKRCDFTQSYFRCCTFNSFNTRYRSARFEDSIIRAYFQRDIHCSIFFDHCYFKNPVIMLNCQIYAELAEFRMTSCVEDLKRIRWTNTTCDKYYVKGDICKFVTVGPIGRRFDYTTYIPYIDWVQCGCWKADKDSKEYGGSLDAFEARVNEVYPEGQHHDEYMNAIQLFKTFKTQYSTFQKLMTM